MARMAFSVDMFTGVDPGILEGGGGGGSRSSKKRQVCRDFQTDKQKGILAKPLKPPGSANFRKLKRPSIT